VLLEVIQARSSPWRDLVTEWPLCTRSRFQRSSGKIAVDHPSRPTSPHRRIDDANLGRGGHGTS